MWHAHPRVPRLPNKGTAHTGRPGRSGNQGRGNLLAEKDTVTGQQERASCPQCGAASVPGAKFCPACGRALENGASPSSDRPRPRPRSLTGWIAALAGAFALGAAATAAFLFPSPKQPRAMVPIRATSHRAPAAGALGLPPGHPAVQLPSGHPGFPGRPEIGAVVLQAEKQAQRSPNESGVWNRYGDLALRFALFNPADYEKARQAFAHVLERDPDNREALRGIGDVYFDTRQYQSAIQAYQRYLRQQPDDSAVLTDLGTLYLSQHNDVLAIKEYRAALAHNADFFPARFNLAVAYLLRKDNADARGALLKARVVAPDESTRTRIDEMIAQVDENAVAGDPAHRAATRLGTSRPQ